jgi:hypothetical protein
MNYVWSYSCTHVQQMKARMAALVVSLFGLWLACVQYACPAQPPQGDDHDDYRVESEYLLRFADFTEWPASEESKHPTINVCVLGRDPYGELLDKALLGHPVGGRRTVIVRGQRLQDFGRCDVLFISSSQSKNESKIVNRVRNSGVLTIGDSADFAARGGIIQFVKEEGRIHFLINVDAARRAGLKINASLLALAQIVHDEAVKGGG